MFSTDKPKLDQAEIDLSKNIFMILTNMAVSPYIHITDLSNVIDLLIKFSLKSNYSYIDILVSTNNFLDPVFHTCSLDSLIISRSQPDSEWKSTLIALNYLKMIGGMALSL